MQYVGDTEKKAERLEQAVASSGGTVRTSSQAYQTNSADVEDTEEDTSDLMSQIVSRSNMQLAYRRVVQNKGAAGVDGMTVNELKVYCQAHWPRIREALLSGKYQPQPIRSVEIPKPTGGKRMLGIPTVMDRLIQQAIHQILQPIYDQTFSSSSYGFRPGRNAHQAVTKAREHVRSGYRFVVDMDLEKFFDTVNHDVLMHRLWKRLQDKSLLKLIRRYLQAGILVGGLSNPRTQGMPQGGPLSPLLSNILLDELDKELEKRDHRFVRYADDCNIYVKSQAAGDRVLRSIESFLSKHLKLKVNRKKSAVARPWERTFLGYSFTRHREAKLKIARDSIKRFKRNLKVVFRQGRGQSVSKTIIKLKPILQGWLHYFKYSEVKGVFEALDGWLRRKLRVVYWRHWKKPRTRERKLRQLGITRERAWKSANNGRGPWWSAGASHMNQAIPTRYLRQLGLISLMETYQRVKCC